MFAFLQLLSILKACLVHDHNLPRHALVISQFFRLLPQLSCITFSEHHIPHVIDSFLPIFAISVPSILLATLFVVATIYLRLEQTTPPTKQALSSKKIKHSATTAPPQLAAFTLQLDGHDHIQPGHEWTRPSTATANKGGNAVVKENLRQNTRGKQKQRIWTMKQRTTHMCESTQNISQAQYLGSSDGKLLEAFFY